MFFLTERCRVIWVDTDVSSNQTRGRKWYSIQVDLSDSYLPCRPDRYLISMPRLPHHQGRCMSVTLRGLKGFGSYYLSWWWWLLHIQFGMDFPLAPVFWSDVLSFSIAVVLSLCFYLRPVARASWFVYWDWYPLCWTLMPTTFFTSCCEIFFIPLFMLCVFLSTSFASSNMRSWVKHSGLCLLGCCTKPCTAHCRALPCIFNDSWVAGCAFSVGKGVGEGGVLDQLSAVWAQFFLCFVGETFCLAALSPLEFRFQVCAGHIFGGCYPWPTVQESKELRKGMKEMSIESLRKVCAAEGGLKNPRTDSCPDCCVAFPGSWRKTGRCAERETSLG